MIIWPVLALFAAAGEVVAVLRNNQRLEYFAKPAVMVCLLIWLYLSTGLQGTTLWFGLGLLFSLVGDVVLVNPSDRMFILGLSAFVLTHIFYLIGFKAELLNITAWSFVLAFVIFVNGLRLLRRIIAAMRLKRQTGLISPVIVYSLLISLMLYAAMSTLSDPEWKASAALFVGMGAFLFYISDLILAWNKFVSPSSNAPILNIVTYYLGQIGLIAGVISQVR